ncbi:HAD family hydrolase [Celeribacter indicus]|uniref:HAD family hydrolase n=1 Tax=Celeribacter indicus TaxID=1208324 RepID=UPI000899D9F2|nr:HAD family hydrolase [Celeribacter indicus]SDW31455.1 phosphoglycolate phosphatase [Celeribacter indicus]
MTVPARGRIAAVLFDKDGTLMDFQKSWGPWARRVIDGLCGADEEKAAAVAQALGFDRRAALFRPGSPVIAGTPEDVLAALRPYFPRARDAEMLDRLTPEPATFAPVAVEGLAQSCARLAGAGIALAVVTNDFEAAARTHLVQMGVADAFDVVIGYDSGFGGKPRPDPCTGAAARLGVAPDACVMVGDSLHDLNAGRAAGMRTVAVLTGVAGAAELAPFADALFPSVAEMSDWILGG